ncbi:MAG: hypothetical protein NTX66_02625 [Candidatus Falkowbacteria bacterium]|nr:hypothetical protein [Candidatus Falkowbacteria bacterium]
MKENFFNKILSKKTETVEATEAENLEESPESEEKINEEIEKESEKFKNNFEELQNDINEFGDEEKMTEAFIKNPELAIKIFSRALQIWSALALFNIVFVGSIATVYEYFKKPRIRNVDKMRS